MADTVTIGGQKIPKPVAFGAIGAVGIGVIYFWRKNKAEQNAVNQAGSSEIDPATGYPYGSPEDAAALQSQGNYQLPGSSGYGFTGYSGGSGSGVFGQGVPGSFNSNAEWAQYVEQYEINNLGADSPTVGNAIGKYLTGQALTTDQVGIVQSAIAIAGYPPVNGPNGNPPSYVTSATTLGGTNPPPVTKAGSISGLRIVTKTRTSFTAGWLAAAHATGYTYNVKQMNGVTVKTATTPGTYTNVYSLHPGWTYRFTVNANPGGPSVGVTVKLPS